MNPISVRRGGRWTLLGLLALLAALALGAQSGSAGQDNGNGEGNGSEPNGKALGHDKKAAAAAPASPSGGGASSDAPASGGEASTAPPSDGSSSAGTVASGGSSSSAAADGDTFVLTVTPEEVSAFVGTSVVVTAHLADGGGAAIGGGPIHFRISGVNPDTANGNTDSGGNVTYTAGSTLPGTDVVSACLHRDESNKGNPDDDPDPDESQKYCDTATIHWVTSPTDVGVVLAGPALAGLDANVTYTATVTNNGPGIASGVTLTYSPPAGLSAVSASATQGDCTDGAAVVCEIGTLDAGESATVTLVVDATSAGTYTSTVHVNADQTDPTPVNNQSSVVTMFVAPDITVTLSANPKSTVVGDTITLTSVVTNNGPGNATGVVLTYDVPSGLGLQSLSTTKGSCSGTVAVQCDIGVLEPGASATVTMVVKALASGSYSNVVDVTGDQSDGNGNEMGTVVTTVEKPPDTNVNFIPLLEEPEAPFTPPPVGPVQGKNVDVEPVSGTVLVQVKGKKKFVPLKKLRRIPVGSIVDVSSGVVKLTSAVNKKGNLQAAVFYDGTFVVRQKKRALTELLLTGGDFSDCDEPESARTTQSHKKKPRQKLWGNGTGQFQTSGQFSSATVRGTKWYVLDTCDGTLTVVKRGVVKVYDFTLERFFVLHAGERHWAKAP